MYTPRFRPVNWNPIILQPVVNLSEINAPIRIAFGTLHLVQDPLSLYFWLRMRELALLHDVVDEEQSLILLRNI